LKVNIDLFWQEAFYAWHKNVEMKHKDNMVGGTKFEFATNKS